MYGFWQRRQALSLGLFIACLMAPVISEAQDHRITAEISLASLKVAPGRPVQGSVKVTVSPYSASVLRSPRVTLFICSAQTTEATRGLLEVAAGMTYSEEQALLEGLLDAVDKNDNLLYHKMAGPIQVVDPTKPIMVSLDQGGPLLPRVSSSDPRLIESGQFGLLVLAALTGKDASGSPILSFAADDARVEVVPGLKTIEIVKAQVRPEDDPVLPGEEIHFDYSLRISGLSSTKETPLRYEGTVLEKNPPKGQTPLRINKWGTKMIRGHADGSAMTRDAVWRISFPRPGDYEVILEASAPGFVPASASVSADALRGGAQVKALKKTVVHVAKKSAAPVAVGQQAPVYWVLDRATIDPEKMEGRGPWGGTITGVSANGFSVNYDQVVKLSNGFSLNSVFKVTASGSPPARLKKGDSFQITVSATATKLGKDKMYDGREPGEQVSVNIRGNPSFKVTASPSSNGMPASIDVGTSTAVGGYGGGWYPSDTRTYTIEVVETPGSGESGFWCYFPGYGSFVSYIYKKEEVKTPSSVAPPSGKPQITLEPDEEFPPLEAILKPDILSVSPRNAMGSATELLIKGFRPNWKPIQVLVDTVDAFGALRINQRLKLQQGGSRMTADMWKANDGWFHWNLTALADLGIQPGIYTVPVIVRQEGHGEVRLFLALRVSARDAYGSTAPPTAINPGRPTTFLAIPDPGIITLKPAGKRVKMQILIEGLDLDSQKPVEVSFPQGDGGRLPGGLAVSPGSAAVLGKEMPSAILLGKSWRSLTLEFLAGPQAQEGEYTIEALIKQEGRGECTISLTIRVEKGGAQPSN